MFLILSVLVTFIIATASSQETCDLSTFPSIFKFGAGTAAYQIEGGYNADGKGLNWWDWFMETHPRYNLNVTGHIACDSYHKYKEDVAAAKQIGLDYYRFSISWSRILPKGLNYQINQAGVDYYNNLLDELIAAGIEPMVTLFHWDTPLALEYLGNTWTGSRMVDYFVDYADLAFSLFGDRVKVWTTINEPKTFCQEIPDNLSISIFKEYPVGILEYLCAHHMILAQAKAYRLYEAKYKNAQNGKIGIALEFNYNMPLTSATAAKEATERKNQFEFGWFAHPLVYGDYPEKIKQVVANNSANQNFTYSRLPKFTCTEKVIIKGAYDVFMLNTYTAFYTTLAAYDNSVSFLNDEQISTSQDPSWLSTAVPNLKVYPEGIRYVLKYIKENYNNPEIYITENGYSDSTGTLNDTNRINFIKETLAQVRLAMCLDRVNVTRYTYWSLLDNLEFSRGYNVKFGLVQVDFGSENLTRTLKNSAYYYGNVIRTHNLNSTETVLL